MFSNPNITINGHTYYHTTETPCTTCSVSDHVMAVKMIIQDTTILECPWCESTLPIKTGSVKLGG